MLRFSLAVLACLSIAPTFAEAAIRAEISLDQQTMRVYEDGKLTHTWPVSTARDGFVTPGGSYKPYLLDKDHHSRKYDDAPMPYSVFYSGGFAVHGTTSTRSLGRPASHGCVRLETANARTFYTLVEAHGLAATRITIKGTPPSPTQIARANSYSRPRAEPRLASATWQPVERGVVSRVVMTSSGQVIVMRRAVRNPYDAR